MLTVPVVPAYCPHCDAIFTPRGAIAIAAVEGNLNIPGDSTVCAHCAGEAVILDGVFDLIADSIRRLADAECAVDELEQLASVMTLARRRRLSREQVIADVQAAAPRLRDLVGDLLPKQAERRYAVYSLLLYVVFDLLALDHKRNFEVEVDVNITPYLTVLIDQMVATRPWHFAGRPG